MKKIIAFLTAALILTASLPALSFAEDDRDIRSAVDACFTYGASLTNGTVTDFCRTAGVYITVYNGRPVVNMTRPYLEYETDEDGEALFARDRVSFLRGIGFNTDMMSQEDISSAVLGKVKRRGRATTSCTITQRSITPCSPRPGKPRSKCIRVTRSTISGTPRST